MSDEAQKFEEIKNKIKWNDNGLVPAITQDVEDGQVLMMAWMNEESLKLTLETRLCHYYSRSRQKLWKKGETSQSLQHVKWIKYDCDGDTLLIGIHQDGNACHTGQRSCFYRDLETE